MRISDKSFAVLDARVKKSALSWMNPMFWTQVSWKEWILFWPMEKFLDSLKVNITYLIGITYGFEKCVNFYTKSFIAYIIRFLIIDQRGSKTILGFDVIIVNFLLWYIIKMLSMKNVGWMTFFLLHKMFFSSFENGL